MEILFGWVTKPYINWNILDSIFCGIGLLILTEVVFILFCLIVIIKDKFNRKG